MEPAPVQSSYKLSQLKQVLDELRTQSHGVEANLADVLSPKTSSQKIIAAQLQKESKKLLAEVRRCLFEITFVNTWTSWTWLSSKKSTQAYGPCQIHYPNHIRAISRVQNC